MALVDYTSSDENEDEGEVQIELESEGGVKRKRDNNSSSELPPLPSKFHDLYASTSRVSTTDDPSLHGGRKRVTPHIEGNWPSHIYIEWYPSTAEYGVLSKLISTLEVAIPTESMKLHSFLTSDLGAPLPLHISLSRPIGLSTEKKDGFLISLEHAIKSSGIRPFDFVFSGLDWVSNFERTRWFLVLRLKRVDGNGLNKLLHVCNNSVQEYGQQPLYAKAIDRKSAEKKLKGPRENAGRRGLEPKIDWSGMQDLSDAFHISIAWTLEPPNDDLLKTTKSRTINQLGEIKEITVKVEEIKAKLGNAITSMHMQKKAVEGNGLFGF